MVGWGWRIAIYKGKGNAFLCQKYKLDWLDNCSMEWRFLKRCWGRKIQEFCESRHFSTRKFMTDAMILMRQEKFENLFILGVCRSWEGSHSTGYHIVIEWVLRRQSSWEACCNDNVAECWNIIKSRSYSRQIWGYCYRKGLFITVTKAAIREDHGAIVRQEWGLCG